MNDDQRAVLRLLVDQRRVLGEDHTRMTSQLQRLLLELIPSAAKKDLSAVQAKALLATVRPRDSAGPTRRRVAAELVSDLERTHAHKSDALPQHRPSDIAYRQLLTDAMRPSKAGRAGHPGTSLQSSVADSHPDIATSDQSLPDPP